MGVTTVDRHDVGQDRQRPVRVRRQLKLQHTSPPSVTVGLPVIVIVGGGSTVIDHTPVDVDVPSVTLYDTVR